MAELPVFDRTLAIVSGYHPHCFPPADAFEAGLRHRFAVVLNTYRRDKSDWYFDTDLFLRLIPALCLTVGCDTLDIHMADGSRFSCFDNLSGHFAGQEEVDREPTARIQLNRLRKLVCTVETEFWTMVGGPSPYHDSYTFSFYTEQDRSVELRGVIETVCSEVGAVISGFHIGEQTKMPYRPWWKRVFGASPFTRK